MNTDYDKYIYVGAKFVCVDISHRYGAVPRNLKYNYTDGIVYEVTDAVRTPVYCQDEGISLYLSSDKGRKQWNPKTLLNAKPSPVTERGSEGTYMYPVMIPIDDFPEEHKFFIELGGDPVQVVKDHYEEIMGCVRVQES